MKHQYEDYIEWIEQQVEVLNLDINNLGDDITAKYSISIYSQLRASLLANKATLERHKPSPDGEWCYKCFYYYDGWHRELFPCPSLLDVTNQLDEVMG